MKPRKPRPRVVDKWTQLDMLERFLIGAAGDRRNEKHGTAKKGSKNDHP